MDELLQNPAVQSGVVPFIVALAVSAALASSRFLALAQVAGFLALAGLAIGFSFESLTATKKLVLIGASTALAAVALEAWGAAAKQRAVLHLLLAGACIWMLWRLLAQKDPGAAWIAALVAVAYSAVLAASTLRVGTDPVRGASAGLALGLGSGALAVLGASAVLGLVGIAVGASAGATLLVQMVRGRAAAVGASISLPAAVIAGLAGVLAVASASLPWYSLLPAVAAPLATLIVPQRVRPLWWRAVLTSLAAMVPMLVAIGLAWAFPINA